MQKALLGKIFLTGPYKPREFNFGSSGLLSEAWRVSSTEVH